MWFTKQKMKSSPCTGYKELEVFEDDGTLVYNQVDLCSAKLPSTDKFDLETQIKGNVDLKQQNTAILQPSISDEDIDELERVFGQPNSEQTKKDGE